MSEGPFTDDMVRHLVLSAQTQAGIIKYAEAMAQFLAEAGRASNKATGDSASFAITKWCDVIRKRALELVQEEPRSEIMDKLLAMKKVWKDENSRGA